MAILVPEQASLGMGSSSITPRETYAGMKDPGNKGAGLMSLAKALGELGATFGDLEAKRKKEAEEAGIATAYWDATVEGAPSGMDGATNGGRTVGDTKPSLFDVNNYNSRTYGKVEIARRKHAGEFQTAEWLGEEGYLNPEQIPAVVRDDPESMEGYLHAGRQKIIEKYRSDPVTGSAALKTYDSEADKLRTQMGNKRAADFENNEVESFQRELNGSEDEYGQAAQDPADVSMLQQKAPPTSRYKTTGRKIVPKLDSAIRDVAGDTWMADYMVAASRVESSGGRNLANPTSSARGPFQFIKSTAKQYGLRNPMDFHQSAKAMAKLTMDSHKGLSRALGREPSFAELYLAHQQGLGGAVKLLSNPNKRAVDIVGKQAVKLNGGKANMTAREFAGLWLKKFNKKNGITDRTVAGASFKPTAGENRFETDANVADIGGRTEPYVGPGADATGLQIASADPNFAPALPADPYPGDENEGKYDYEVQGGEKFLNEDGDEVVYVPDNPMVLSERRKLISIDRERDKTSTLSRVKRRDLAFDHYYNKAIESKDPAFLDVMPPEWQTPEQRAKTVKLRESMEIDISEKRLREDRVRKLEEEERHRTQKSDMINRRQEGEEIDPYKEAYDPATGLMNEDMLDFARKMNDLSVVPRGQSNAQRAVIESTILSSVDSGNWRKLGFDTPPSDEALVEYIQNHPGMNVDDKSNLLGKIDKLQEGANIMNDPTVNKYYEDTVGRTVKNLTSGFVNPANPQSVASFANIEQDTRQFFDDRMAGAIQAYIEDNKGAVPRGSALRALQREVLAETTTWVQQVALPFAQNRVNSITAPEYTDTGTPVIPTQQLVTTPSSLPGMPPAPAQPASAPASQWKIIENPDGTKSVVPNT